MSVVDWLFPDVAAARRSALARIDALKARYDLLDAQYDKIHAIARDVAPLIQAAEMNGRCPASMRLELTAEDCDGMDEANLELFRLGQQDRVERVGNGATLFGVRIVRGTQRRVVSPTDGANPAPPKVRSPE